MVAVGCGGGRDESGKVTVICIGDDGGGGDHEVGIGGGACHGEDNITMMIRQPFWMMTITTMMLMLIMDAVVRSGM